MKKVWTQNILRRMIQLIAFIAVPGLFIDIFTSIKTLVTTNYSDGFSGIGFQLILLAAVIVVTALVGRFFCGFMCAFGSMEDLAWFIGRKLHLPKIKISQSVEKNLKYIKYLILIAIIVGVWILGSTFLEGDNSSWNVFGQITRSRTLSALLSSLGKIISIGGLTLLVIFVFSMFIERPFCRYGCPLGGVFAIISKFRLLKIKKPVENCSGCRKCTNSCPMGLSLSEKDVVTDGDCISCLECVRVCPTNNAGSKISDNKVVMMVIAVVCCLIIAFGYYGGLAYSTSVANSTVTAQSNELIDGGIDGSTSNAVNGEDSDTDTVNNANETYDTGKYSDGVYTGTGTGYRGSTEVSVTVSGGKITKIVVNSSGDDWQYLERAESTVVSNIINNQTPDVDAVSGATFSSNGIMEAVADALGVEYTNNNDTLERGHGGH